MRPVIPGWEGAPEDLYAKSGFRELVALDWTWFGGGAASVYGATVAHLGCS